VVLHDSMDEQYLAPVAMTCLSSTSLSKVQPPYLSNTCCALVWMCLVSIPIANRIRLTMVSHVAFYSLVQPSVW
jgi:hypothetical protein